MIFQMQGHAHYEIRRHEQLWRDVGIEALEVLSVFSKAKAITIEGFSWATPDVLIPKFHSLFLARTQLGLPHLPPPPLRVFPRPEVDESPHPACPALITHVHLQSLQKGHRYHPIMDSHLESLALGCQQLATAYDRVVPPWNYEH
ncbi:hypothetical protein GOP47_0019614 [Adiantum capillus-veneris]|uniref:Uncharacterized protein n=1 Tax=Adiantum capillus-veneris TaxID=13818 RepID=A0A9D4UCW2_ADICA|nr:hypothetical protein GOP47_0019614 [Adiantum capillus-veneris]